MLEARIEELTFAIRMLTDVLRSAVAPAADPAESWSLGDGRGAPWSDVRPIVNQIVNQESYSAVKHEHEAARTPKVEEIPNASQSTTDISLTSEPQSKPVAYSDVSKLVTEIVKKDLPKAKAALARLGVKHGRELTEAQWPEAVAYLTRVAAGELDPEASHA